MEQDVKNTNRKVLIFPFQQKNFYHNFSLQLQANYSLENSDDLVSDSEKLRDSATAALDKVLQASENVEGVIENINALSQTLSTGEGRVLHNNNSFVFSTK